MARMTAMDMVKRVWKDCGRPQADQMSNDDILQALNLEATSMAQEYEPPELTQDVTATMTPGVSRQTITVTNGLVVKGGRNTTRGGWMKEINARTYNRLMLGSSPMVGQPYRWVMRARTDTTLSIDVWPRPIVADVCTFVVIVSPSVLHVDNGVGPTLEWHPNYDDALVERATIRCQRWMEKYQEAGVLASLTNVSEDEAITFVKSRGRRGPGQSIRSTVGNAVNMGRSGSRNDG